MKRGGGKMNKKIFVPALALLVLGGTLWGVSSASAENSTNPESTLVQKIADKFNLNKDDVQKVFDEEKATRQAEMQKKNEDRLNQLVKDGKITEAQKTLIINKQKELMANKPDKDSFKNLTPAERKSQMDAKKTELENWAKENSIDIKYLMVGFGGHGFHGGPMMGK